MAQFRKDRVEVDAIDSSPAAWTFAGRMVKGTEHRYSVIDRNYRSRNCWEFVVRVPRDPYDRIEVRPVKTPNDRKLTGLDRRSITFMRGTKPRYTGLRYCPLALAVPDGSATRALVRRDQKSRLPQWLRKLGPLHQKSTVRSTRGTDGHLLVVLARPDDHAFMITAFLACKAWVLKQGFSLG